MDDLAGIERQLERKLHPSGRRLLIRKADAEQRVGSVIVPYGGTAVESGLVVECGQDIEADDPVQGEGIVVFWSHGHSITVGEYVIVPRECVCAWQEP